MNGGALTVLLAASAELDPAQERRIVELVADPPSWLERFVARIDLSDPAGCWPWVGARNNPHGYGTFWLDGRKHRSHRLSYALLIAPIPSGSVLDHFGCDNRGCVNPWHVRPTSHRENTLRGSGPAAANARKTHCPRSHPLSGENLHVRPSGQRVCRACDRDRAARRRARRREGS